MGPLWVAGSLTPGLAGSHGTGTLSKIAQGNLVFQPPSFGADHQAVQTLGDKHVCQHPPREDGISLVPSASVIPELLEMLRSSPRKVSFN